MAQDVQSGGGYPQHRAPSGDRDPEEVEQELVEYAENCYMEELPLDVNHFKQLLYSASGPLPWSCRTDDGIPLLHMTVMVGCTHPAAMQEIVAALAAADADPNLVDGDGDTAMEAAMALAEDDPALADDDEEEENAEKTNSEKMTYMSAVLSILRIPTTTIGSDMLRRVCSWLRKIVPRGNVPEHQAAEVKALFNMLNAILHGLSARSTKEEVTAVWCSEELLEYLEKLAYDTKGAVQSKKVAKFLDRGAMPSHSQNGATCLLLVVLNPYTPYEEMNNVFKLMIDKDPEASKKRDVFKLSAVQWAADYVNVASQHKLNRPNPSAFLTLVPLVLAALPPDADVGPEVGISCLKVSSVGSSGTPPKVAPAQAPRFLEGDRVVCRVEVPGSDYDWEEGIIVALWYRESCWPSDHPGAPYEVLLDLGQKVFAIADDDRIIYKEAAKPKGSEAKPSIPAPAAAPTPAPAPAPGKSEGSSAAAPKPKAGPRFVRRQREDGKWEMLDTISGRTRPIASDSDSED